VPKRLRSNCWNAVFLAGIRWPDSYSAALPILNSLVPQTEQIPVVAGLPFFIVVGCGSFISRFCLHFMQYASILSTSLGMSMFSFRAGSLNSFRFAVVSPAFVKNRGSYVYTSP